MTLNLHTGRRAFREKCIFKDYWKSFYFRFELFRFKVVI